MSETDNTPNTPNQDNTPSDEGGLTEQSLEAKLAQYRQALKEEWQLANEAAASNETVDQITKDYFKKHVPIAAAQIVHLMQNSSSDSVKLNASKIVITEALKSEAESGDPIQQLLDTLTAGKKPVGHPEKPTAKNGQADR